MSSEGGYIEDDDVYWLPTGREIFDMEAFYLPIEVIDAFGNSTTITYDGHSLLVESVEDALGNTIEVENDYRVLGPVLVTDPNGNRGAAKIDELGMVIATAVMGKVSSSDGDTLEEPTTIFEYDLERWSSEGKPNVVHNAVREEHGDSGSPWQHSYTYLDGLGGELMKKVQAEPGLAPVRDEETGELVMEEGELVLETASPRWVGTGRVVLDNKGNPIKKYEPFFSATHEYEDEAILVEWGVTPIMRYDALGRLIRTEMPDGSVSRVEFTPWEQSTFDGNDTVLETGNAWYAARQSAATPTPSTQDQRAATLAVDHADTPAVVFFDVLGRPFLGIEDNGGTEQYSTRAVLDIEGNPKTITDARGNIPAANTFDLLGRALYSVSCDAGARWSCSNVVGNPIRVWDSRDHVIRTAYDDLHRRIELWVKVGSADEVLAEQTIYGEGQTDPEVSNLRGKVYQVKDGAGVLTNVSYDFKGNLLEVQRQLAEAYATQLDWSDTVTLETETFVQTTEYDALNRPTSITTPDSSEIKPTYNEAGLLEKVEARIRDAVGWTTFVDDIDYDAKGQRDKIVYGNGVYTECTYDPQTYRVKRIKTTRDSDDEILQDLRYTYDAVGNIVEVADLAHETFYHGGHEIKAVWQYEYDALYRLTYATGREHVGTNDDIQQDENGFPLVNGANPNDPSALRNYEEWFEYDQVGNILKMIHDAQSSVGDWTRHYHIAETNNRLLDTSLPGDDEEDAVYSAEYTHDAHGNMLTMPHLDGIDWDFKDQMRHVDKGGGGDVYFVYDASGQRIRKVWEHSGIIEERIYLGGFELYRRHEMGDVVLERETLHIMDDAQRIAMVEPKTIDTAADPFTITPRIRYQCSNHLGSAMLELDQEGLVISYEEYHPYGTSAYRAVNDSIEVSARRYRYTGKERDEETGLYYHGARYYACWLARWTSADPAGMVDGVNLFQYVRGRPIGSSDPTGKQELNSKDPNVQRHRAAGESDATIRALLRIGQRQKKGHGGGSGGPPKPAPSDPNSAPGSGGSAGSSNSGGSSVGGADPPTPPGVSSGAQSSTGSVETPGARGTDPNSKVAKGDHAGNLADMPKDSAEKAALLVGILTGQLDHDFMAKGASAYGIVGGQSENGPEDPVLQTAAVGFQAAGQWIKEAFGKVAKAFAFRGDRVLKAGPPAPKQLPQHAPRVSEMKNDLFLKDVDFPGKTGQDLALARSQEALARFRTGKLEIPAGLTRNDLLSYRAAAKGAIEKSKGKASEKGTKAVQEMRIQLIDEILASGRR